MFKTYVTAAENARSYRLSVRALTVSRLRGPSYLPSPVSGVHALYSIIPCQTHPSKRVVCRFSGRSKLPYQDARAIILPLSRWNIAHA